MVSVEIAKREETERISRVLAASWRAKYRGIINDAYLDSLADNHWVDFITAGLSNGTIFSMILRDNQKIIGASIIGKTDKEGEAHLLSLYLLPDRIGHGLGHLLYYEMEKEILDRGFTKCVLDVLEDNRRAICFYESHGFEDTDVENHAILGNQSYVCKVFAKELL